jgi:hypothetical protein
MSSWEGARFQYGQKVMSTQTSVTKKDQERAEIEELTAQYLLTKKITKVAYGVRADLPKWDFEN